MKCHQWLPKTVVGYKKHHRQRPRIFIHMRKIRLTELIPHMNLLIMSGPKIPPFRYTITKTCLYNFDPLKPHLYIVKLGFTGVYIIFLISAQKHRLWYSLEPPRRGGSDEYPQSMFRAEIWKKYQSFLTENFQFLEVKFSIYLYRRVFVMRVEIQGLSDFVFINESFLLMVVFRN